MAIAAANRIDSTIALMAARRVSSPSLPRGWSPRRNCASPRVPAPPIRRCRRAARTAPSKPARARFPRPFRSSAPPRRRAALALACRPLDGKPLGQRHRAHQQKQRHRHLAAADGCKLGPLLRPPRPAPPAARGHLVGDQQDAPPASGTGLNAPNRRIAASTSAQLRGREPRLCRRDLPSPSATAAGSGMASQLPWRGRMTPPRSKAPWMRGAADHTNAAAFRLGPLG